MEEFTESKISESVWRKMLILIFVIASCMQPLVPLLGGVPEKELIEASKIQATAIIGFALGLFQLLVSVQIVLAEQKKGFYYSVFLNALNIIAICISFFVHGQILALPGIPLAVVSIILASVLKNQFTFIAKKNNEIDKLSKKDAVTGLPNRGEMLNKIQRLTESKTAFTAAIFDIDNFKLVNDSYGHSVGDMFILENVRKIRDFIGKSSKNLLGRLGGDEFMLIMQECENHLEAELYVRDICEIIKNPFFFRRHEIRMTASVGIIQYPKDSDSSSLLFQRLDMALYRAKSLGKDRIVFFDEEMQLALERKANIEQRLRDSIAKNEVYVEYQPQYKVPEKNLRGFEVLARWRSPALGEVSPLDFIPLAEESGFIVSLGNWILKEACTQYMRLCSVYDVPPILSVNVSVIQLRDPDFIQNVNEILKSTGMLCQYLEFEITESVCIQSPEFTKGILNELKNMGIRIALDDFGTGYSSLNYLRMLPFDVVKIDKSFIDTIKNTPDERNIVTSIIDMAHQLDLEVIAEGIERTSQFEYLVKNKCDYIQGNLLGRPLPVYALI